MIYIEDFEFGTASTALDHNFYLHTVSVHLFVVLMYVY